MHKMDIIYVADPARPDNEVFYYLICYKDLKLSKQAVLPGPGSAIFSGHSLRPPELFIVCYAPAFVC